MRWFPVSEINTSPFDSTATPDGLFSSATEAGMPSPLKPAVCGSPENETIWPGKNDEEGVGDFVCVNVGLKGIGVSCGVCVRVSRRSELGDDVGLVVNIPTRLAVTVPVQLVVAVDVAVPVL